MDARSQEPLPLVRRTGLDTKEQATKKTRLIPWLGCVGLSLAVFPGPLAMSGDVFVVHQGELCIQTGPNAPAPEQRAAQLVAEQISRRTGLDLALPRAAKAKHTLHIGTVQSNPQVAAFCRADKDAALLGPDGFLLVTGSAGDDYLVGQNSTGCVAGAGAFLRMCRYAAGALRIPAVRVAESPEKPVRGIYFATHFFNYYHTAPVAEVGDYIEELALAGDTMLQVWFDMHHFQGIDDPAARAHLKRLAYFARRARGVGMKFGMGFLANEGFAATPGPLKARSEGRCAHYGVEVCPSVPGGVELIARNQAAVLDAFGEPVDILWSWPYDQGGCACQKCMPWGANGFLRTSAQMAKLYKERFPEGQFWLSTWWFSDEAWELAQAIDARLPAWAKDGWRWRLVYVRAKIDHLLKHGEARDKAVQAELTPPCDEIRAIYHVDSRTLGAVRPPAYPPPPDPKALARGKRVAVSSTHPDYPGSQRMLTDGVLSQDDGHNFWIQDPAREKTATLTVDLGAVHAVKEARLQFRCIHGVYWFVPATVNVAVSKDGRTFLPVHGPAEVPKEGTAYSPKLGTYRSGIYPRKAPVVHWEVDFTALLRQAGVNGILDVNAIRVAAEEGSGSAKEVPCAFLPGDGFEPRSAAKGEVAWQVPGEMAALESRRCWVYFDVAGATPRKATKSARLALSEPRPANLVRNAGFERVDAKDAKLPAEWHASSASGSHGKLEVVHGPCRSGHNALKIQCSQGYSFGCEQTKIPMKPNTLYRASVWAHSDAANPNEMTMIYILVFLSQADGRPVSTPRATIDRGDAVHADAWKRLAKRGLYLPSQIETFAYDVEKKEYRLPAPEEIQADGQRVYHREFTQEGLAGEFFHDLNTVLRRGMTLWDRAVTWRAPGYTFWVTLKEKGLVLRFANMPASAIIVWPAAQDREARALLERVTARRRAEFPANDSTPPPEGELPALPEGAKQKGYFLFVPHYSDEIYPATSAPVHWAP